MRILAIACQDKVFVQTWYDEDPHMAVTFSLVASSIFWETLEKEDRMSLMSQTTLTSLTTAYWNRTSLAILHFPL